jgi:cell wall-associated NlpC family hydrolase
VRRLLLPLAAVVLAAVTASTARPAPPRPVSKADIAAKSAQAQRVLAQVQAIDLQLGRNAEAFDGARFHLQALDGQLATNRRLLAAARRDFRTAQRNAQELLVQLYTEQDPQWLDILLGATDFADLIDRIDTARAVGTNDGAVAAQVARARATLERRERTLERQERAQRRLVARLAAQRAAIRSQLAERQRLLDSIRSEVQALRARRAQQEAALAAAARRRVAARLAAERRAQARARAEARAAARRRATPKALAQPAQKAAPPATTASAPAPAPAPAPKPHPVPAPAPKPAPAPAPKPAPPPRPAPSPPPASGGGHPQAASIALRYLGVPYRWGGASPSGFDCSGLVMYVYAQLGISLPHFAAAQYRMGSAVSRSDLQPGDLVFFDGLNHVGIYIGGNQFVHAPHTGDVVRVSTLTGWFASTYVGARRI